MDGPAGRIKVAEIAIALVSSTLYFLFFFINLAKNVNIHIINFQHVGGSATGTEKAASWDCKPVTVVGVKFIKGEVSINVFQNSKLIEIE